MTYFVRFENIYTGKIKCGTITCNDIGSVMKVMGKYGWVCTKQYLK